jgi:hypothetical protein
MSELTLQHVLADLFDSDDFPAPIPDPEAAPEIVVPRLIDAGFEIKAFGAEVPKSALSPVREN